MVKIPEEIIIPEKKRFQLNSTDFKKVGKGALIAVLGALLTYGTEFFTQTDLGDKTALYVAIWSILVNAGWKWISKHEKSN